MYSHCTHKMIASGNNSHSEPANCPNFINPTVDPRSPCSNSLAWLLHWARITARPTLWPCNAAAVMDSPVTQHIELGGLVFHQRCQKALREAEVPLESRASMELPSLLNEGTRPTTPCNYLVNSHVWSQTHRSGSRTEQIYHHSHLCNTSCLRQLGPVWSSWVGSVSLRKHDDSQHGTQETAQDVHRNDTSQLHGSGFPFGVRRMWKNWVHDLIFWSFWVTGDLHKCIMDKSQTLPGITIVECLLQIWKIKRQKN